MTAAIGLAGLAAFFFGGSSVVLRMGLNRVADVEVATVVTVGAALVVALVAAALGDAETVGMTTVLGDA